MSNSNETQLVQKKIKKSKASILASVQEALSDINESDPEFFERCLTAIFTKLSGSENTSVDLIQNPEYIGEELVDDENLIKNQHQVAKQYPGEHVILVGTEVFYHSPDRLKCLAKYEEALELAQDCHPIMEPPDSQENPVKPVFRGRSLVGPEAQQTSEGDDL